MGGGQGDPDPLVFFYVFFLFVFFLFAFSTDQTKSVVPNR